MRACTMICYALRHVVSDVLRTLGTLLIYRFIEMIETSLILFLLKNVASHEYVLTRIFLWVLILWWVCVGPRMLGAFL